jgi:type I phosphodiesterase/nucleotide pyrophosphatase
VALAALLAFAAPAEAGRVVLLGVDGASWSVIDPLLAEGALPHFAALARDGVSAELATVEPVNSPTVWTSIATGRSPEAHGITNFFDTALDRQVPTVFERLAASGRRVGLYDYLATWPPPSFPGGFVIPGWTRRDLAVTPGNVFARAGLAPPYRYSNDGLHLRADHLASAREELKRKAPQWLALSRAFDVEVGAVTFYAVDALSHRFWRDAFPDQFEAGGLAPDPANAGVIREALVGVDRALGEIRGALGPEDVLLVASDHGFQAEDGGEARIWTASLQEPLRAAGLDAERDAFRFVGQFYAVTIRVLPGPFEEREALTDRLAAALGALRSAGGGEPLYSVDVLDAAPRPPGRERTLLQRLRQWGVRQAVWWLFDVEFGTDAHAFLLAQPNPVALDPLWPGGRVAGEGGEWPIEAVAAPDDFTGRHQPTAVFLAAGGPILPHPERLQLSVLEIAPLIAQLAGAPVPDDFERPVPVALLDPAWLSVHPPQIVPAASLPAPPRAGEGDAAAGEEALRERLRSLGYIR